MVRLLKTTGSSEEGPSLKGKAREKDVKKG